MMWRIYWWFSDLWWYNTLVLAYNNGEEFSLFYRGIYFTNICSVIGMWGGIHLSCQGAFLVCEFWHFASFCCVDLGYFGPKIKKHKHCLNSLYGRVTSSPEGCNCNFFSWWNRMNHVGSTARMRLLEPNCLKWSSGRVSLSLVVVRCQMVSMRVMKIPSFPSLNLVNLSDEKYELTTCLWRDSAHCLDGWDERV